MTIEEYEKLKKLGMPGVFSHYGRALLSKRITKDQYAKILRWWQNEFHGENKGHTISDCGVGSHEKIEKKEQNEAGNGQSDINKNDKQGLSGASVSQDEAVEMLIKAFGGKEISRNNYEKEKH